jgi:hypothetical protein
MCDMLADEREKCLGQKAVDATLGKQLSSFKIPQVIYTVDRDVSEAQMLGTLLNSGRPRRNAFRLAVLEELFKRLFRRFELS